MVLARAGRAKEIEGYAAVLKAVALFEGLDDDALLAVAHSVTTVKVTKGQALISQGEVGDGCMYVVLSGHMAAHVKEAGAQPVCEYSKGGYFGEQTVISRKRSAARGATITATEDTTCIRLLVGDSAACAVAQVLHLRAVVGPWFALAEKGFGACVRGAHSACHQRDGWLQQTERSALWEEAQADPLHHLCRCLRQHGASERKRVKWYAAAEP